MIVDAGGKRTRAVADTTVLEGRHMVNRLAARSHAMAGGAIVDDAGVVDECVGEAVGVVAHAAVFDGNRMRGHRGRLAGCINAVVVVVARFTWLDGRIDDAVAEDTAKTEGRGTVAGAAVDERHRMAGRLAGRGNTVAGITSVADDLRAGMVRVGARETFCRVTGATFGAGVRVGWGRRLAFRHRAVMTPRARPGNTRMIEAAVGLQFQKMSRVVAVVAFDGRRHMEL